jgi:hypothetical protein
VGQGAHTALVQMTAEAAGVEIEQVRASFSPTRRTSGDSGSVSASRMTWMAGNSILGAVEEATKRWMEGDRPAIGEFRFVPPPTETLDPDTGTGQPNFAYGYVAESVDVSVDIDTGHVRIDRVVCADDVGKAINPALVIGQIEGAVVQASGYTLSEDLQLVDGRIANPRLSTYLIPGIGDIPSRVDSILVEHPDPRGPWGVRGMAEMPFIPLAPAVVAAIHDATGVWIDGFPLTPSRVLAALSRRRRQLIGRARSADDDDSAPRIPRSGSQSSGRSRSASTGRGTTGSACSSTRSSPTPEWSEASLTACVRRVVDGGRCRAPRRGLAARQARKPIWSSGWRRSSVRPRSPWPPRLLPWPCSCSPPPWRGSFRRARLLSRHPDRRRARECPGCDEGHRRPDDLGGVRQRHLHPGDRLARGGPRLADDSTHHDRLGGPVAVIGAVTIDTRTTDRTRPPIWRELRLSLRSTVAKKYVLSQGLVGMGVATILVYQVPAMTAAGLGLGAASFWAAFRGFAQLGGRLPLMPIVPASAPPGHSVCVRRDRSRSRAARIRRKSAPVAAAFAVVAGFGIGASSPLQGMHARLVFGAASLGTAMGLLSLAFMVIGSIGPAVAGAIATASGSRALPVLGAAAVTAAAIALINEPEEDRTPR